LEAAVVGIKLIPKTSFTNKIAKKRSGQK
jgi:hypothetical protein